ncbi:uncharacterized protein LOC128552474 [Mercenaria mercenaria]|uniref:uncharacterized protein LOC128552474 n=1 Tax=Mercenaria mercenaria TaxID=6596 RepID=UPI00234E614F|nr:uncharacterized protein LOC128552474 [Mercenaria mercenaria]
MMFYAICFLFLVSHILVCEGRQGCQNGWVTFDDSCYLFADEIKLDWTEATHFCASHGGSHVATIENEAELLFLRTNVRGCLSKELAGITGFGSELLTMKWKVSGYGIPTIHACQMDIRIGTRGNQRQETRIIKTAHVFGVLYHTHGMIVTVS